jgi:hypothetical protein
MNAIYSLSWLVAVAIAIVLTGCEPTTFEHSYSVPERAEVVAEPSSSEHFRWPVVEQKWRVTRPTDVAFLRKLKRGELGEIAEKQAEEDLQRIEAAKASDETAPWLVASTGLTGEAAAAARRVIGEFDSQLMRRESIEMPAEIVEPMVWIDNTARHMLIGGQNGLWMSKMPWRPTWKWASPDFVESRNPSWEFKRIALPTNEAGDIHIGFFGVDPDGSDSKCVVAHRNQLHLVDCNQSEVITSLTHDKAIIHISVAKETGHTAVVDTGGNLLWSDPGLRSLNMVDVLDIDLPMPAIAPDASRITTWRAKDRGGIYTFADGAIKDNFNILVRNEGDPLATWCSKEHDFWIEKGMVLTLTADEQDGYQGFESDRIDCYWDTVDLISLYRDSDQDTQLVIADRPTGEGGTERVLYDARLQARRFYAPHPLDELGNREMSVATSGAVLAFYDSDSIDVYDRIVDAPQSARDLHDLGREWSWANQFEHLEALHDVIRQLPETRFGETKEHLYASLVNGIAAEFFDVERAVRARKLPAERLETIGERFNGYQRWIKTESPLVLATEICRQSKIVLQATSNVWMPKTAYRFDNPDEAGQKGMAAWSKLRQSDDVPASAYGHFLTLARGLRIDINHEQVEDAMKECILRYPCEKFLHCQASHWRTKLNELNEGVGPAYAEAVSKAVGPPMGDYLYFRCAQWIHSDFPIANIDGDRVRAGIEYAMKAGRLDALDAIGTMRMTDRSYSFAGNSTSIHARRSQATLADLANYYRLRFPVRVDRKQTKNILQLLP